MSNSSTQRRIFLLTTSPTLLISSKFWSTIFYLIADGRASKRHLIAQPRQIRLRPFELHLKPSAAGACKTSFLDDRGFPDQSDDYNHVLHNIDKGPVLCKLKHPVPDLNAPVDPAFYSEFIPEMHKSPMRQDVDLSHLKPDLQEKDIYLDQRILVCV